MDTSNLPSEPTPGPSSAGSSYTDGWSAALTLAPSAARGLRALEVAAWREADASLADLAARVCALQVGLEPMTAPAGVQVPDRVRSVDAWRSDPSVSATQQTAAAFAEQFTLDVSCIDDALRGALVGALGADVGSFVSVLYIVDVTPRAHLLLDRLFGPSSNDGSGAETWPVVSYAEAFDVMLKEIAKLDALDPIVSELVRLRGARQHQCRICKSRRSRTAILAGANDATFDSVDLYETSDLPERTKTALRLTDTFIWQPAHVSDELVADVRARFSPAEAVELVLDLARNAANKAAVAFGVDTAVVDDGVELYEIDEHGDVLAGMAL
jgi:alkylhydroperoxidase family enzyme